MNIVVQVPHLIFKDDDAACQTHFGVYGADVLYLPVERLYFAADAAWRKQGQLYHRDRAERNAGGYVLLVCGRFGVRGAADRNFVLCFIPFSRFGSGFRRCERMKKTEE